jgi:hypothetical protein
MQAGMRELLSELDGSRASRVAMLAGMTRAELDSIGGVRGWGASSVSTPDARTAHAVHHGPAGPYGSGKDQPGGVSD